MNTTAKTKESVYKVYSLFIPNFKIIEGNSVLSSPLYGLNLTFVVPLDNFSGVGVSPNLP